MINIISDCSICIHSQVCSKKDAFNEVAKQISDGPYSTCADVEVNIRCPHCLTNLEFTKIPGLNVSRNLQINKEWVTVCANDFTDQLSNTITYSSKETETNG